MNAKKQRREHSKRFTEDGLPRDANEWTVEDWIDLHIAFETVKRKVAKRHEPDSIDLPLVRDGTEVARQLRVGS